MRLSDLAELDNGLPEGAETMLEPAALSPEEEARILAMTLAKAGLGAPEKGERRPMKKARFGAMLFAAALCAGTVAASAAGYFTMHKDLARHLNAGEKEAPLVSQAGLELGESATAEGWTITAAQAMGDKTQVKVLLEVTAPEGTVLEEGHYRLERPMIEPSVTFTIDNVDDDDPTDNKIAFVLSTVKAKDYQGKTMKLHVGGVSRYKKYTVEELNNGANPLDVDKLVTADFDMSFKLDYEDTSETRVLNREVDTPRGAVKVEEISLSAQSIYVKLSGEGTMPGEDIPAHNVANGFGVALFDTGNGYTVGVRDKDGNDIQWTTADSTPDSFALTFQSLIDPADVGCIVINGVEIPLEEE